jgi:pimeloyl-ACP methyl ester carboxylesterase
MMRSHSGIRSATVVTLLALFLTACPSTSVPGADDVVRPTGLTAALASDGAQLAWRFEGDTTSIRFGVERSSGDDAYAPLADVPGSQTTWLDATIEAGTTYTYRVRAVSPDAASAYSDEATYVQGSTDVGADEIAFLGSESTNAGVGVPSGMLRPSTQAAASIGSEPRDPVDRRVVGPVLRFSVAKADLELSSDEPLRVLAPPTAGLQFGPDAQLGALIRISTATGDPVEFPTTYAQGSSPIRVEMWMLRDVDGNEGLPEIVEIEIVPMDSSQPSLDAAGRLQPSAVAMPEINHLEGLFRFDDPKGLASMEGACSSNEVDNFPMALSAYGATQASGDQSAWTRDVGKAPLVLVHGWQANPHAWADLNGRSAEFAAALCGWRNIIASFHQDSDVADSVALYTFGYDSVRDRVATNAAGLERQLATAFGEEPVFVIAHSMGGMVTRDAIERGANVAQLYSLGTPYRGSPAIECTSATLTTCSSVESQIETDFLERQFLKAQMYGLRYPGTKDLAFETAFGTHEVCERVAGLLTTTMQCTDFSNEDNPYLSALNGSGPSEPERYTGFAGNILKEDGTLDRWPSGRGRYGPGGLGAVRIYDELGRFSDQIVSIGSAAFTDLDDELSFTYDDLGSIETWPELGTSGLGTVVLAPCMDHSDFKTEEYALLKAPSSGGSCDTADPDPNGTVFGWISADVLGRLETQEPPPSGAFIDSTVDRAGLPAGDWNVTILYPSALTGASSFDQIGASAPVASDGRFTLDVASITPPPVPLTIRTVPVGATITPDDVQGAIFSMIVFDDADGDAVLDSGEALYLLNDPQSTLGGGVALDLTYADRAHTITGTSSSSTNAPVTWDVDADAGWGRTIYIDVGGTEIEVGYSNGFTGIVLEPDFAVTASLRTQSDRLGVVLPTFSTPEGGAASD